MRFVEHDELPALASAIVKQWAVVGADEQVLQHRVVGEQDVGRSVAHFVAEYHFTREAFLGPPIGVAPPVPAVLGCLADVLTECRTETRPRLTQAPTDVAQPVSLVVGERVHRVEDHGPDPWLAQLASEMLAV